MKQINKGIYRTILAFAAGLLLSVSAFAQDVVVKGHVKDALGSVMGANVIEKGNPQNGTTTDLDGNFLLTVPENSTLVVMFIGYKTVEVSAAPKLSITIKQDTEVLGDAVVIGYGKVKKKDLTGSVTAISADKMVKGVASSASDMLVGKAAGVSVITNGGAPGAGATIRIRGGSSMSASNNPLIVIDGVPVDDSGIAGMENPLATVHPNDIENFTILKDASATAIYGSRASNGVIIINTKRGKSGMGTRVNYSGNFAVNTIPGTVDVMSASEFSKFVNEKFGENSIQAQHLGEANTDWQKEILRTSFTTDHNVSVTGSVPHLPYRVSMAYTNDDGILKTSNMQRLTGAISLTPSFIDNRLKVQANVKGIYNKNRFADTGALGMATQFDPTQPVHMDGNKYGNGYFMYMKGEGDAATPIDIALCNPVAMIEQAHNTSTVKRSIGNLQLDYKSLYVPGLSANLNLGYDISKGEGDHIIDDNSPMTWCSGGYKKGFGENSSYYELKRNTLLDFYFNYNNDFGKHHVDAMAGYSWQRFYRSNWSKFPYSEAMAQKENKEFYKEMTSYKTEHYLVSFFGRLNYTFNNKYLFTFTLRDDGSSRFNEDNRWGLFPSAAFAWKIKEENFLKNVGWLSDLKLRTGYGVTGQQNLGSGDYPYMARYMYSKPGASYTFGDTVFPLIAPLAYDADLKWEETKTYNAGLDFGFLKDKITGTLDVYYRETDNLLNTVTAPAGTNFSNQLLTNVGTLTNKGIEFSLTAHPISTEDWHWTLGYNISYNKNEITKLTFNDDPAYKGVLHTGIDGATGYTIMINAVNNPYNSFYVCEQKYDVNGKPVEGAFTDKNGDNKIDENDLFTYKKAAPDVFMGLTSQLGYKNWDLAFSLRASLGNYVYNNVQSQREAWDGSQLYDQTGFLKNRIHSAWHTDFHNPQYRSTYYVQNASFLKMDNISLGYTFDKIFNDSQSARIAFTVQNVFTITDYDGLDPEISGSGVDHNIYPRPRVFMLGLNLNF